MSFKSLILSLMFLGFYSLPSFAESFKCQIDFEGEPNLTGLGGVSKGAPESDILVHGHSDHYKMSYGNGEYEFGEDVIERQSNLLRLSRYEVFGGSRILIWVLEISLAEVEGPRFGMIYGESPWAVLSCESQD